MVVVGARDWAGTVLTMSRILTPDERAAIAARYQEVANASQVAREFDVDEKTVRRIAGASKPNRADLHARACARGVREGRRALTTTAKRLGRWLEEHGDPEAPTMEPGDVSKMAQSLRGIVSGVIECDEHRERKQLTRLTKELRRAELELKRREIELAELKIKAGGVEQHSHSLTASVVVLPELDADGSVAAEPRPADASAEEHRE